MSSALPSYDEDDDESTQPEQDLPTTPEASPTPAPNASPLNPIVSNYLQNKQALIDAQQKTSRSQLIAGLSRAGGQLAHAISGATGPIDETAYNAMDANAQAPIQQETAQQALQGKDPNSALAAQLREIYKPVFQKAGIDPKSLDGLGADDIKAFAEKPLEFQDKMKTSEANKALAVTAASTARQDKLSEADKNRQLAEYNATVQQLEQMRNNPAVAQAEKDIYAAQKASSLIKVAAPDGNLDNMSAAQSKLLQMEIGKIASGGQASEAELNALDPSTLSGKLSKVWGELSNNPTPANAGAFLKQYRDYANSLTKDAQNIISDRYGRIIGAKSEDLSPSQNTRLKNQYINRFQHSTDSDGTQSSDSTVNMVDPSGKIRAVPKSKVKDAIAAGGKLAGGQ